MTLLTLLNMAAPSVHLVAYARQLAQQGDHHLAVVFANASCELHMEFSLSRLLDTRSDKELVACVNLMLDKTKMTLTDFRVEIVFACSTAYDPRTKRDWWNDWIESRKIRHRIAHKGGGATKADADSAVALADKFILFVTELVDGAVPSAH